MLPNYAICCCLTLSFSSYRDKVLSFSTSLRTSRPRLAWAVCLTMQLGLPNFVSFFLQRQSVVFLLHPSGQAVQDWLGLFA